MSKIEAFTLRSMREVVAKKMVNVFNYTNQNLTGSSYNETMAKQAIVNYEEAQIEMELKKEEERKFGKRVRA